MNPKERTDLEDRMFCVWLLYWNLFRGGPGQNPHPDPEDHEIAGKLTEQLFAQMPAPLLASWPKRLASVVEAPVRVGAYWGRAMTVGHAEVIDAWWVPNERRPAMGKPPATKLARELHALALLALGTAPETGDDVPLSWAAHSMVNYEMPELKGWKPVADAAGGVPLPELHMDILYLLVEAGLRLGVDSVPDEA